ncbi:FirrV-1-E5 [Feldmannia irregularis virus a]|uniref:FirrV-1-E5 n=1 Tax=Feldmannia irregularis virus a TaxID=231992 RepID=Q6XLV7_9PHYC|nr:FirrV-1-E5 [Feldmannia irregularis virus a]AAR26954.1 FirrV-1-E5 [Feldmannia irregularis virus a]
MPTTRSMATKSRRTAPMPTYDQLMAHAKRIALITKPPSAKKRPILTAAAKKKRAAKAKARRQARVKEKCPSERAEISEKFKAAVPSAHKIARLDYPGFVALKKEINQHVSKVRAHANRCNDNFVVPEK